MFITIGSKEHCDHEHETFDDAQKCLKEYQEVLKGKNRTSDRIILEVASLYEADEMLESKYY